MHSNVPLEEQTDGPYQTLYHLDSSQLFYTLTMCDYPGRPGVATVLPLNYRWSTLLHMEVVRSVKAVTLLC